MISIQKSLPAPSKLTTTGATHRTNMEQSYDQNPTACLEPKSKLIQARKGIYGHDTVKQALKDDQYDKCCYCERDFTVNYHGDVEHFRPKGGYKQDYDGQLIQPGYYWLAYEWNNLYFACALCNQTYKGNFFPLANHPAGRADGHIRDTTAEIAQLVDLATEDPEKHITFEKDVVKAQEINGKDSVRGEACITAYGLDNVGLTDKRREFLEQLISDCTLISFDFSTLASGDSENGRLILNLVGLHNSLEEFFEHVEKVKKRIHLAAQDSAEFAGMVRAFIKKYTYYSNFITQPNPVLAASAWQRTRSC